MRENERVKVYVGRRSMSAGDDMNAPNMASFYLPDSLDEFAVELNRILPFDRWTCYLGAAVMRDAQDEEDGILVAGKDSAKLLISAVNGIVIGAAHLPYKIIEYTDDWHDLVAAHPYLFCE